MAREYILISYAKAKFEPKKYKSRLKSYSPNGASAIASSIYFATKKLFSDFSIIYMDSNDEVDSDLFNKVHLFIGIENNFHNIYSKINPKYAIIIGVNRHPIFRTFTMLHALKKRMHVLSLDSHNMQLRNVDWESMNFTESIYRIQLGSFPNLLANMYAEIPLNKQFVLPLRYNTRKALKFNKQIKGNVVLMLMGVICYRKGFYILPELVKRMQLESSNWKLRIIGTFEDNQVREHIKELTMQNPEQIELIEGFVPENSRSWEECITNAFCGVFPSLEEGYQDAASLIINQGIPIIYSSETGLDLYNPRTCLPNLNSSTVYDFLDEFYLLEPMQRLLIWESQKNYIGKIDEFEDIFERLLKRSIVEKRDSLWPPVQIRVQMNSKDKTDFESIFLEDHNSNTYFVDESPELEIDSSNFFFPKKYIFVQCLLMALSYMDTRSSQMKITFYCERLNKSYVISRNHKHMERLSKIDFSHKVWIRDPVWLQSRLACVLLAKAITHFQTFSRLKVVRKVMQFHEKLSFKIHRFYTF
jgi:hypothetical protein